MSTAISFKSRLGFLFWPFFLLYCVFILYTIALCAVLIALCWPIQFISLKYHRLACEFIIGSCWPWWPLTVEVLAHNKLIIYGDDVPTENAVVISNHSSYADWLVILSLASRKDRIGQIKMQVKNSIKYIPFVGVALQGIGCMLLTRNWEEDKSLLKKTFHNLKNTKGCPFWIVSHPEGSRVSPAKLEESHKFAKKRDLPILNHVLLPRVKGFIATVTQLNQNPTNPTPLIDAVYDLTIAYSHLPPDPFSYFSGMDPVEIHLFVRRYPIHQLPTDEPGLSAWLYKLYTEKDQLLEQFQKNKQFDEKKRLPNSYFSPNFQKPFCIWLFGFVIPSLLVLAKVVFPSQDNMDDKWY